MILAIFLVLIFKPVYYIEGEINLFLAWILIGFPFGIKKMYAWFVPFGHDLGSTVGIFFLNVIIGGIIGGFVLIWRLVKGSVKVIRGYS